MKKFCIIFLIFLFCLVGCSKSTTQEEYVKELSIVEEYVKTIKAQDVYLISYTDLPSTILEKFSSIAVFMITASNYNSSKSAYSLVLNGIDAEYTINKYFHENNNFETEYCIAVVYANKSINFDNISIELYDNNYSTIIQDASVSIPIQHKSIDDVEEILKINGHYYLLNDAFGYTETVNSISQEFQLIALDTICENIDSYISYELNDNDIQRHIEINNIPNSKNIVAFEVVRYYDLDITTSEFYDFRDKFLSIVDSLIITTDNGTITYELYHK